jgi:hypothetical protein
VLSIRLARLPLESERQLSGRWFYQCFSVSVDRFISIMIYSIRVADGLDINRPTVAVVYQRRRAHNGAGLRRGMFPRERLIDRLVARRLTGPALPGVGESADGAGRSGCDRTGGQRLRDTVGAPESSESKGFTPPGR